MRYVDRRVTSPRRLSWAEKKRYTHTKSAEGFVDTRGCGKRGEIEWKGEEGCGFGTQLTCSAFLWRKGHMRALPTLGGNNGQATAINNRGQITGFAENGTVDSSCSANATNNRIQLPVI